MRGDYTGDVQDISRPLDNRKLEAKANTQEWDLLLTRVFNCHEHTLRATTAESSRNKDTTAMRFERWNKKVENHDLPSSHNSSPSVMIFGRIGLLRFGFEIRRFYPLHITVQSRLHDGEEVTERHTVKLSFRWTRKAECSRALITDI